jgi:signal transduction histidine kinase
MKQFSTSTDFTSNSLELLSAITHELKTPLNAIISFSDVLREDINNPNLLAECLDYISKINRAAVEMNELVNDLLDVGAIASGNFSVDLSCDIDVGDVLKRAMRINHDYALKRNVSLKFEIGDDVKFMKLDEKRMKQVLTIPKHKSLDSDNEVFLRKNCD